MFIITLAACAPEPVAHQTHTTTVDHGRLPIEGAKIIGIVFRLAGAGEEVASSGVVYLEDAPKEPGEGLTSSVNVEAKAFAPLITVVTTGGVVTFTNKDPLPHHVFSPDLRGWDTGVLKRDQSATRHFDLPGAFTLLCNIHPEMLGYVLVIPSTAYGRLGVDGRYVIPNVHAGTYKLTAWVPRTPPMTQAVTVGATGTVTADFHLQP